MRITGWLFSLVAALCASGCRASSPLTGPATGAGGAPVEQTPCDPLAPQSVTVGDVIGVGQADDGTLYVAAANGVFVSRAGTLFRQHVTGTGQSGSNEYVFTVQPLNEDGGGSYNLLANTQGGAATAMALGPSGSRAFLGQTDAGVTGLAVVPPTTIGGMPVVNTPNVISYIGDVAGGAVIVVTVPMDVDPSAKFQGRSVFYGPPDAVVQREIVDFQQSLSGNGSITFLVGTTNETLTFGFVQTPDGGPLGTFALLRLTPKGGAPVPVTLRAPTPASLPSDLVFSCSGTM
ncbi:MAG: hypothetical protein ACJ8F1_15670 [Polyangia bacterium]